MPSSGPRSSLQGAGGPQIQAAHRAPRAKKPKFITAGDFSAGLEDLKQLLLSAAHKTPENADSSAGGFSGSESPDDGLLRHKPAHKAPAVKAPTATETPTPKRGLKFLEDEASAAQAASKAAFKHAKETSDAASRARSGAGSKKMPCPTRPDAMLSRRFSTTAARARTGTRRSESESATPTATCTASATARARNPRHVVALGDRVQQERRRR